ncbi:hypothetical protein TRIP_E210063 [uncultured Spirochaetota bacterium]|nr:hypothetical protein TRIP_E210063 [uncultured Spirochaetota bacterium]
MMTSKILMDATLAPKKALGKEKRGESDFSHSPPFLPKTFGGITMAPWKSATSAINRSMRRPGAWPSASARRITNPT